MTGTTRVYRELPDLTELLRRQHGVVTRAQLRRLGVTRDHVAHHREALRWRAVSPTVLVAHLGPLTRAARRWVAILGAAHGSAIGSWSALELHGLQGWQREPIHVVVPRGSYPDRHPWLVVHESRRLREEDVVDAGGLPVHGVARAAVDAAAWQRSWRTAAGLMAVVVQQRLVTTDGLFAMLDTVGRVRHRKVMRLALADVVGGADARTVRVRLPATAARYEPERVLAIVRRHLGR